MKVGAYVTVIVDLPVEPVMVLTFVGLAVTVNAVPTVYVTEAERDNPPAVPVTVTVNVPDVAESIHDKVDVPEVVVALRATLPGIRVHIRPMEGEMLSVSVTVPVKP